MVTEKQGKELQECDICHRKFKDVAAHKRIVHPEAAASTGPPAEEPAAGPGPEPEPEPEPEPGEMPINPELAKQILTPMITGAVKDVIREMKLPELINTTVDQRINSLTDQIGQKLQAHLAGGNSGTGGAGGDQAGGPGNLPANMNKSDVLFSLLVQKALGGAGGADQGGNFERFLKEITAAQQVANFMNTPMLTGMKMMSDMLTVALRAGVSPEDAAKAAEEVTKGIGAATGGPGSSTGSG